MLWFYVQDHKEKEPSYTETMALFSSVALT